MGELIYEEIAPITKVEAQKVFDTGESRRKEMALLSSAYFLEDWRWVQDKCLAFIQDSDSDISLKNVALICLGHIARIHGELDEEKVMSTLKKFTSDPEIGVDVSYVIEEIEWFLSLPHE